VRVEAGAVVAAVVKEVVDVIGVRGEVSSMVGVKVDEDDDVVAVVVEVDEDDDVVAGVEVDEDDDVVAGVEVDKDDDVVAGVEVDEDDDVVAVVEVDEEIEEEVELANCNNEE
jgi:hypothetical protein